MKHISPTTDQNHSHIKTTQFFCQIYKSQFLFLLKTKTPQIFTSLSNTHLVSCSSIAGNTTSVMQQTDMTSFLLLPSCPPFGPSGSRFKCIQPFHLLSCCQKLLIKFLSQSVQLVSPEWNKKCQRVTEATTLVILPLVTIGHFASDVNCHDQT